MLKVSRSRIGLDRGDQLICDLGVQSHHVLELGNLEQLLHHGVLGGSLLGLHELDSHLNGVADWLRRGLCRRDILSLRLLELGVGLLKLGHLSQMLIRVGVVEIFVAFADGKKYLAALVAQLPALHPEPVVVVHVGLCSLRLQGRLVVDEEVGPVLGVGLSLFHPDRPHFAVFPKDMLDLLLARELRID